IMRRKPRDSKAGIFAGGMGVDVIYQGAMVSALTLVSYLIGCYLETGAWAFVQEPHGITMAFLTMSMAEVFHSFNMRSQRGSIFTMKSHNKVLWLAMLGSFVATTAVCEIPFLAGAFGLTAVNLTEYAVAIGLGLAVIPIVEIVKLIQRKPAK
ncbi:MAG: cation transporting ATPase C-terminal domain-containing protein, partial [Clostridia bacterium]|nr:cation transporting ATPase C-terminal domain-containing protein [Clostridia bacterium]